MSFLFRKETNRLWYNLLFEVRQLWFVRNVAILFSAFILILINYFFDVFDVQSYIFVPTVLFFSSFISIYLYLYLLVKSLCKVIEKQQETIDLLMLKAGLSNASALINVENKEELVETLCKYLPVVDADTRCFIAESLGELGGPSANETLKILLVDTNEKVRVSAHKSLEKLSF